MCTPLARWQISYNGTYRVLLNNITALELIPNQQNPLPELAIRAVTSNEASVDVNGDGEIWVSAEQNEETPDLYGKFNLSIEACASQPVTRRWWSSILRRRWLSANQCDIRL